MFFLYYRKAIYYNVKKQIVQTESMCSYILKGMRLAVTKKAKRYKKSTHKIIFIVVAIILCIGIFVIINYFRGKTIENKNEVATQPENTVVQESNLTINEEQAEEEITQIGGYAVIGKIKIPKIGLEDVILEKTTDDSLNLGLTKFWGPEMNEIGNFSITGHNYKIDRSELFSKLDNLIVGDTFSLEDQKGRTVTYKAYKKYTVDPKNTTPIDQNKDGKREVTLITCTKGAKERIIIKAREV